MLFHKVKTQISVLAKSVACLFGERKIGVVKSVMFGISDFVFYFYFPFLKLFSFGINYQGYLLRRCSGVIPITASQHHISPEHKKKSEPFAYRLWVRISTVWCGKQDLNLHEVAPIRT